MSQKHNVTANAKLSKLIRPGEEPPTHGQMRRNTDLSVRDTWIGLMNIVLFVGVALFGLIVIWRVAGLVVS